jgi:hypothetical protein
LRWNELDAEERVDIYGVGLEINTATEFQSDYDIRAPFFK